MTGDSGGALSMGVWASGVTLPHLSPPELANIPPRQALSRHPFSKGGTRPKKLNFLKATAGGGVRIRPGSS